MGGRRGSLLKIGSGVLILIAAWAALAALALYRTRRTRIEAGEFLRAWGKIEVGKSQQADVTRLVDKFHGKWRTSRTSGAGSPCGDGASVVDFDFQNIWLHRILLAPLTNFGATIYLRDNLICFRSLTIFDTAQGFTGYHVQEFGQPPHGVTSFRTLLNPAKTITVMDATATSEERSAAYSVNLDCLTQLRGCREAREMAPTIWKNSREVGPTLWQSQWDP